MYSECHRRCCCCCCCCRHSCCRRRCCCRCRRRRCFFFPSSSSSLSVAVAAALTWDTKHRWKNCIKINLRKICWKCLSWIQGSTVVDITMNLHNFMRVGGGRGLNFFYFFDCVNNNHLFKMNYLLDLIS